MTIPSNQSLDPRSPKVLHSEVIEISDSDDEVEEHCKARSNGNCRRQSTAQKRSFSESTAQTTISNGDDAKRFRALPTKPRMNSNGHQGGDSKSSDQVQVPVNGVADENNVGTTHNNQHFNQKVSRHSQNGSALPNAHSRRLSVPPYAGAAPSRTSQDSDSSNTRCHGAEVELRRGEASSADLNGSSAADGAKSSTKDAGFVEVRTESSELPIVAVSTSENVRNQKQFLKPPSPKNPLSKKEFQKMSLEEVDDLITK